MAIDGAIAPSDLDSIFVTDSVEEAIRHLERHAIDRFALRAPKPSRWLGESVPAAPGPGMPVKPAAIALGNDGTIAVNGVLVRPFARSLRRGPAGRGFCKEDVS